MKESERNLKGKEFEKNGEISKAIELYELNVSLGSAYPFPYKRLALIYKKQNDIENEIRVLKLLLSIEEKEAKRFKWVEGSKEFDKVIDARKKLQKALERAK
jgi:hypothetical protein